MCPAIVRKAIKVSSRKAKGRRLQQWVRDAILDRFSQFGLTEKDVRSVPMGVNGVDIQLSEAASKLIPWDIEAKNHKKMAVFQLYKQACGHGNNPCLVIKQDRDNPLVVIDAEKFFDMLLENELLRRNQKYG